MLPRSLRIAILLCFPSACLMADTFTYVSLSGDNRIAIYDTNTDTGVIRLSSTHPVDGSPGCIATDRTQTRLFVAIRDLGYVASFSRDTTTGRLRFLGRTKVEPDPAYLFVDHSNRFVLSAYYPSGKVAVHEIGEKGRIIKGRWRSTAC